MRVWFDPDNDTDAARHNARAAGITGEMIDISTTGVAFSVFAIRVKDKYLVGHERPLNIEIDLPNGKVNLRAIGKRYERDDGHLSTEKFHVGALITHISESDRATMMEFIRGRKRDRSDAASISIHADR
jgi:hypothetical protein